MNILIRDVYFEYNFLLMQNYTMIKLEFKNSEINKFFFEPE
jgi:hypothetical protein